MGGMKKGHSQVTFKPYTMDQPSLLPPSLEELIPADHLVRVVNRVMEELDLEPILNEYKGGGTSSYHPRMLLKVLVYAYTQKVNSSRQIAKALRENVNFMWISGGNRPDFRTINRFRSSVMKEGIEVVFSEVLQYLIEGGYVPLENYFLDGTKIEANANKYKWVWGRSTEKYKARLQEKIQELLEEIEAENEAEQAAYGEKDLEEVGGENKSGGGGGGLDSEGLRQRIEQLNERLGETLKNRKDARTKAMKKLKEDCLPRQQKYEEQEKILAGRKSYAKTDHDATFMRMKEDAMLNGQLKPGYNVQIGTENQFVVGYSIHQNANDMNCLIPHLERLCEQSGHTPATVVADAGYGSEENYAYLEKRGITAVVKYPLFSKQQKRSWRKQRFRAENWEYDSEQDVYICPSGQSLTYQGNRFRTTSHGYRIQVRQYECDHCGDCPLKPQCTRSAWNRRIEINPTLLRYQQQARERLLSEWGKDLRARRGVEVEPVFGRIKQDWSFRRFTLRGMEKVKIEWGLLCIAHNLAKLAVQ
jgi:transposase